MIVTIGRQMGSGGREIGQRLAQRLGIGFYDKELLYQAARRSGISPELFERCDEKSPSILSGMVSFAHGFGSYCFYGGTTPISDDGLHRALGELMTSMARDQSFVVVGRSADYVLRNHPRLVSVFVHAPMDRCVERIMARSTEKLTPRQARAIAEKANKLRADYYNFYTDKTWGAAASYDLSIDSSILSLDKTVDFLAEFVRLKTGAEE